MATAKKKAQKTDTTDQPLTREIRSAITDDGRTNYALAMDAGVDESALRRFQSRERSLSLETADKLAVALGLQLVRKARPKARASKAE